MHEDISLQMHKIASLENFGVNMIQKNIEIVKI